MIGLFDNLRQFHIVSVLFRLLLAILFGGVIGLDRGGKRRAAGFRTHILVCMGAALTMLPGEYEHIMLLSTWQELGQTMDVSRFGAQVINGIGFLGAGTVIVTGKQQVKGLTTAASLWASACMGLAIGSGFYECVIPAFVLILVVIRLLPKLEAVVLEKRKNINLYIEFDLLEDVSRITNHLKASDVRIYEVEISRKDEQAKFPSAVFMLRLNKNQQHAHLILGLSELNCVRFIEEL